MNGIGSKAAWNWFAPARRKRLKRKQLGFALYEAERRPGLPARVANAHARRLAKRLHKYGAELLTLVEFEGVPPSNNHAEREVRPAVLMRKASYGSQSERGAATRGVLMSVCRTLKNRGLDPLQAILDALRIYATTGRLPPLPEKASSGG